MLVVVFGTWYFDYCPFGLASFAAISSKCLIVSICLVIYNSSRREFCEWGLLTSFQGSYLYSYVWSSCHSQCSWPGFLRLSLQWSGQSRKFFRSFSHWFFPQLLLLLLPLFLFPWFSFPAKNRSEFLCLVHTLRIQSDALPQLGLTYYLQILFKYWSQLSKLI